MRAFQSMFCSYFERDFTIYAQRIVTAVELTCNIPKLSLTYEFKRITENVVFKYHILLYTENINIIKTYKTNLHILTNKSQ